VTVAAAARNGFYFVSPSHFGLPYGPVSGTAASDPHLSEPSLPAVTAASAEARRRGAKLRVIHVPGFLDIEAGYLLELGTPSLPKRKPEDESAKLALSEAVAKLGVEADCAIVYGRPAATILRAAEGLGAELVVVGTHGRTGLARIALGSTAEKVVNGAHCSVLAVRLAIG
jgi:universal stress protein A